MNEQQQKRKPGCLTWIILIVLIYLVAGSLTSTVITKLNAAHAPSPTPLVTPSPAPTPQPTFAPATPSPTQRLYNGWDLFSEYGSAGLLDGTTVVVSIFASDEEYAWNWDVNNGRDNSLAYNSLDHLGVACSWITAQAQRYGAAPVFYYDWSVYNDLFREATLDIRFSSQYYPGVYSTVANWIHSSIDSEALLRRYGADNIVYLLFVNQPAGSTARATSWNQTSGRYWFAYEFCLLYIYERGAELIPAAIAHEILHCFGARDLYMAGDAITQEYVDYLNRIDANDIMRSTWDPLTGGSLYTRIANEISPLDAYYLGLTDSCGDVLTWGLGKSEYQP